MRSGRLYLRIATSNNEYRPDALAGVERLVSNAAPSSSVSPKAVRG